MKNGVRKQRDQIRAAIPKWFPKAFNLEHPLPLAIGVKREIQSAIPSLPSRGLNKFLWEWCKQDKYLDATAQPGAVRVHLDGSVSEPVTKDQQQFAAEKLARHRAEWKAHRERQKATA